jgi:lipopolysaccharide biosynthesis glycosyltransferase
MQHVIAACDDFFAMPLTTMAASVIHHARSPRSLHFTVIDCGITARNRARLVKSVEMLGACISIRPFRSKVPTTALRGGLIPSLATYARLYAADYAPQVDRAVYLDCDTVVATDINALLGQLCPGALVAGVADSSATEQGGRAWDIQSLQPFLEPHMRESTYINAGVLVLDLNGWRGEGVSEKCSTLLAEHAFARGDQDVINIVCAGRIQTLPLEWNVQTHTLKHLSENAVRTRLDAAKVVHYTERPKPWHRGGDNEVARLWYEAVDLTAWHGWRPTFRRLLVPKLRRGWRLAQTQPARLVFGLLRRGRP